METDGPMPSPEPPEHSGQGWRTRQRQRWLLALLGVVSSGGIIVVVLVVLVFRTPGPPLPFQTVTDVPLPGDTSRFDYQSLDPAAHRLFIAHLGASQIIVFDTQAQRVVATIPQIAQVHGVLVVSELGRVYASATGTNQIAVIDEQTLRVIATIPGGDYPDGMAYDPEDGKLFVSDEAGQTETVIDAKTNQAVATLALGGEAGNTQYDPVSRRIFVDVQTRNQVVTIDPTTNRIVGRMTLPGCDHDHSLLLDAQNRLAFATCDGNAVLLVVDLRSMQVLSTQSVGADPDVLAFDHAWQRLYVAAESGILSVFEEQGRTVRKVAEGFVANEAHSVAVDEQTHRLYLPLEDVAGKPVLRIAFLAQSSRVAVAAGREQGFEAVTSPQDDAASEPDALFPEGSERWSLDHYWLAPGCEQPGGRLLAQSLPGPIGAFGAGDCGHQHGGVPYQVGTGAQAR